MISPLFDTLHHIKATSTQRGVEPRYAQDYDYAVQFLYSYRGSEATFNAYRRELERLLHWSWRIAKCSILTLKREQIEAFVQFCQNPPSSWIGAHQCRRFVVKAGQRQVNVDWRPFVLNDTDSKSGYLLSQKAVQAIFAVLSSFYHYLIQEQAMAYNPVSQIRQKSKFVRKVQNKPVVRRLSELQWSYVIDTALRMANEDSRHERTLFIMNALFGMYLRISELSAHPRWMPQMGHFHRDHDQNWWFKTVGKGNKERVISVSDAMLQALKRYRHSLGLSALPSPGESMPLILSERGGKPISSTRQIRNIVQVCFDRAVAELICDGFQEEADVLKSATVHWLRHTGISEDVKRRPREHVRDDAGHGSSAITDHYIDVEHRERHASAKHKTIHPDAHTKR